MDAYDVVIVGGSYAGLSAALLLGRSMRRVLVVDTQRPANRQTPYSHSFLTQDGAMPTQLATVAREQVARYPTVAFLNSEVVAATAEAAGFQVKMADGAKVTARKLLLATGVLDELVPIPGLAECWGISVLHCPYCHGYEVRGQQLGLLANGAVAAELVALLRNWSRKLTVFTNGPADFTPEHQALLQAHQVPVVEEPILDVPHQGGYLSGLRTADGQLHPLEAVFARFPTRLPGDLARQLGCSLTETGLIQVTEVCATNVPNLFAAGDATTGMRQVAAAVAQGAKAGAWLNRELITDGVYADV